jgi:fumarylacetoacetate (FAA) hydrolase
MFSPKDRGLERGWPGRLDGDRVIQLAAQTLQSFFTGGGQAREHAEFRLDEVDLRPPVLHPPSVRVFSSFERDELAFFFANPASIYGHEDEIPYPEGADELDYGLGVAAVVGAEGRIGGFTVMNDWTARDVRQRELNLQLPPAKSKDFATSLGPFVVTGDELGDLMLARVNDEERARWSLADLRHTWDELVGHAALNTVLRPGDVIASGSVPARPARQNGGWRHLGAGDVVELEVEGIGVLRNTIGVRRAA